jgi:ADP-heptose:LPS heptosyltransferase
VKLVSNLGARVLLEAPDSLARLVGGEEGISQLVIKGETLPPFDYQCSLMSLPLAFQTNISNIPNANGYIQIDVFHKKILEWNTRLGSKVNPRIGLVWSGNSQHKNDNNRSILLENLLPFLPTQFEYISLQKEVREVDKLTLKCNPQILSFASHLNDFEDTAALISCLDLVVSVDTSVAHLSGAIGKKTWVLLPYIPDWRWLLDREDSAWYSSMKLYRQSKNCNWNDPLEKIKEDLLLLAH